MSKILYDISIVILNYAIHIAAIFGTTKAKNWVTGRKKWKESIVKIDNSKDSIWIHAASHGEGLMAIPLMKKFSEELPNHNLIISFFSPSGFQNFNYEQKNLFKVYLPIDYKENAEFILHTINPKLLIFVKYDFWFNLINMAHELKIPTLCFSTKIDKNKWFIKSFWKWQNKSLKNFSAILTVDKKSNKILNDNSFTNTLFSGDTRYDQVNSTTNQRLELEITKPCIIIGSSWKYEEEFISEIIEKLDEFQIIIAPHNICNKRINEITSLFGKQSGLYSKIKNDIPKVLIIDNIGLLADLYQLSQIAIVGGGFTGKLHNIIEPAAKENYLLFGPKIEKFPEAIEMIENGFANTFKNSNDLLLKIKEIEHNNMGKSRKFILNKKGATEIVFKKCQELLNHSNTSASSSM
jgi:3-deoxy-D-manno-octulosonic-acid transferase